MNEAVCRKTATVTFWEGYAKWYRLWLDHTDYHRPVVELLKETVEPGWRILDIGAGSGVLSFPLAEMGCTVTALEPSLLMRSFLYSEMFKRHTDRVDVDDRRWEDVSPMDDYPDFDLILSCNTLHLTSLGFETAWRRSLQQTRPACLSSPRRSPVRSCASPTDPTWSPSPAVI